MSSWNLKLKRKLNLATNGIEGLKEDSFFSVIMNRNDKYHARKNIIIYLLTQPTESVIFILRKTLVITCGVNILNIRKPDGKNSKVLR